MTGTLHGLALRVVGLGARLALLAWVLPGLAAGEVTRYLLLTTLSALAGRLLGLGLEDELPLVIQGDLALARRLYPACRWPLAGAGACALAALAAGPGPVLGPALAVASASLALCSTLVLVGLLRTLSPARYEWLLNAPAPLLLLLARVTPGLDAPRLVLLGAGAQVAVAVAVAASAGLMAREAGAPPASLRLRARLRGGAAKLAGNLLLVAQVRALGWLPAVVGHAPLDALSYAVLVGEAGFQLGSVAVQRHFAAYARGEGSAGLAARRGLACWAALLVVAALLVALPFPPPVPRLDLPAAAWALVQAGALVAALEARSFLWSRRVAGGPLLVGQVAWLLALGAVVLALPAEGWLPAAAGVTGLLAALALLLMTRSPAGPAEGIGSADRERP